MEKMVLSVSRQAFVRGAHSLVVFVLQGQMNSAKGRCKIIGVVGFAAAAMAVWFPSVKFVTESFGHW
jgi:hypothetical protein